MSRAHQPPLVTGISPNEGTSWTKVTIRGENLGTGPADLVGLSICGHNCLLTAEWMSASKIVCHVGPAKDDKGEIIVSTKSGGHGTSTVSFKLLKAEKIGILDQSAVWVDEMNYYDMRTDRNKGISPLSLRPSNPLGIDVDKGKVPLKDLEAMFPGVSGDFTSENFSATWYLIENHSVTSFDQLRMAASNLKKQATKKNEGSLAYVKGGLSTFFEAQDALAGLTELGSHDAAIHQRLESDGTEKVEGSMTQRLENVLNRASDTADTLFQEVLGRKDKADSTRNALNVLQRFKFLFNLPFNIERNIHKGDYDVVINDYEKAKSLFGNTEVPVFKKVYAEVETRIGALRSLLLDKLLETPSTLHDQKRYIRYLSDLHAPGDPAWQCIYAQHKWILGLMQNCKEEFINDQRVGLGAITLDLEGDPRPSALSRIRDTASLKRGGSLHTPHPSTWRYETPQQVQFVEKLSDVVIGQLPNFWKLWISYVNGSLFSETGEKSGQVEKSKKNARQRQNDFKKMIEEVTHRLVKLVRGALLPSTLTELELRLYGGWESKTELTGPWLTQVIHTVRIIFEALVALEIPNDLLQVIQDLLLELRHHCLLVTLHHTAEDIKRLAEKEDWVVDNEGITSLPAQFEQCMVQMLQSLKEPMETKPGEVNILQLDQAQDQVSELCVDIMRVFVNCLEQLSAKTNGDIDTSHISLDLASPDLFSGIQEDFCATPEQRLLIILSNCQYLEKHTFFNMAEHFEKHGFTGTDKITQVSVHAVKELDESLFDAYIERKSDPIVGSLEPGIYAGYFDWRDCSTPTGVRNYLKEALVNIITVHAEVFTVSRELVPRVLTRIVDGVAEEMTRLMQCVSYFSMNGAIQARLEISALRDAVASYLSSESHASFKQALEALPQLHSGADQKLLEELLNKFKSSMHLQLTCFQPSNVQPVKR
ncbi:exocyst complex component 2 isoform X1 [Coregonus clupeaformis]|uniref:exocyst complex component 2 isoform X1 n=1 Tax=Coregonus clupeaformis TaxID=59861 RepID=UPI001BDFD261|nr:exocyst complex component 2 isoform X1 [Coregonus clupeaformis]XP_041696135.1 exocyst complex component 2 isoform X1 [Coregonus clupeaformis]